MVFGGAKTYCSVDACRRRTENLLISFEIYDFGKILYAS